MYVHLVSKESLELASLRARRDATLSWLMGVGAVVTSLLLAL